MKFVAKIKHGLMKNGPEIAVGSGAVLIAGGTIWLVVKSIKKIPNILKDHEKRMEPLNETKTVTVPDEQGMPVEETVPVVPEAEKKQYAAKETITTVGKVAKEYVVPLVMIGGGTVLMAKGAKAFKGRYIGTAAALAVQSDEIAKIRERLSRMYGENVAEDIFNGTTDAVVEEANGEDGSDGTTVSYKKVFGEDGEPDENPEHLFQRYGNPNQLGYCKFLYNSNCAGWNASPLLVLDYLKELEHIFTEILHQKGYLYLNEVLKRLDIDPVPEGQVIGWSMYHEGCDHVSFGITEVKVPENIALRNLSTTYKNAAILTFNCCGNITGKMYKYQTRDSVQA